MEKRSLIKVGVIGAESTGKTWLCERLAAHFNTAWRKEAAREYFKQKSIEQCRLSDLDELGRLQLEDEKRLSEAANRFLFCDTTFITLHIWAELEFGNVSDYIRQHTVSEEFDLYLLTANDVLWEKDDLRFNKHSRDLIFNKIQMLLAEKSNVFLVNGLDLDRLASAIKIISKQFPR